MSHKAFTEAHQASAFIRSVVDFLSVSSFLSSKPFVFTGRKSLDEKPKPFVFTGMKSLREKLKKFTCSSICQSADSCELLAALSNEKIEDLVSQNINLMPNIST